MHDRFVGQQFGNYRLLHVLGQGSFAVVYLGEHIYLKSLAAIKILHARLTSDLQESFLNEARILARLSHMHIVRLLDFGIKEEIPFLVMEYAPHGTLRQRHPSHGKLPLSTVAAYIKQISNGLHYAHRKKLIYRDLKPENILIGDQGELLISDFGVALIVHTTRSLHDAEDVFAGTAPYMAPEQVRGVPQFASDQYALGIMAYEWLCGTRPFQGTIVELYKQHLFVPPKSLREHVPQLPAAVEQVVLTALEKEPDRRFTNIKAFAVEFECACQQEGTTRPDAPLLISSQPEHPISPLPPAPPDSQVLALKDLPSQSDIFSSTSPQSDTTLVAPESRFAASSSDPNATIPMIDHSMVTPFYRDSAFIDWLQQQTDRGLLSPQMSASLIAQVAEALQHAHAQQVIHQQLAFSKLLLHRKAGNLGIPDLWLTGFEPEHADQSKLGEPLSMASEQWQGRAVPATDQYALAVIAYRLVTGEFPFKGSREQVKDQHLHLQPLPPSHYDAELPPPLDTVLLKALAKQPEKRFVSVTAFASAFAEAAHSKNGLCSTFIMSAGEAQRGVSRRIALPENRHINLTIPAGAYDGQIIHQRGQGAEDLFVIISIDKTLPDVSRTVETDAPTLVSSKPLSDDLSNEPTLREVASTQVVSLPETPIPVIEPVSVHERITVPLPAAELFADEPTLKREQPSESTEITVPPENGGQLSPDHELARQQAMLASVNSMQGAFAASVVPPLQKLRTQASRFPGIKNILILLLASLIIGGSGAFIFTESINQQVTTALQARATAQIRAVATSFASTAVVQASATATAAYDPYSPAHGGILVFADPLRDNAQGHNWQEVGSSCEFLNDAYQISSQGQGINTCAEDATALENFTYQAQMTITQGDAGGLIFRYDETQESFYYFSVSTKGSYSLYYSKNGYSVAVLNPASSDAIQTGTGQPNVLAVVAQGRNVDLCVNHQHLAGITDATVVSGQIGVAAESNGNTTEANFYDAKAWKN